VLVLFGGFLLTEVGALGGFGHADIWLSFSLPLFFYIDLWYGQCVMDDVHLALGDGSSSSSEAIDYMDHRMTYSRRLLAEQADGDVSQSRVDQDSLGNVMEVSWNGGLSSRDLRFAVWQRCESRCFAAAVAHDFCSVSFL
jgi:hypothetical protein